MRQEIKMIFADLDGTMLDDTFRIPEENVKVVKELQARNIPLIIATGRMFSSALTYAKQLNLTTPIISYNGAVIQSIDGQDIFRASLKPESVKKILPYVFEKKWYVQLYHDEKIFYVMRTKAAEEYEKASGIAGFEVGHDGLLKIAEQDGIPKLLLVINPSEEIHEVMDDLKRRFVFDKRYEVALTRSSQQYIDIIPKDVSKKKAIALLAKQNNISLENVMAIGDSGNDMEMILAAGLGVAMGNASDEVKLIADYITTTDKHAGFAEAVKKFVL